MGYIYIWSPPPQGLPFYFLHERDLFADVQCPLGLQMPCRKHCNLRCFCALFDIVSDVLSILDAKQDSRKQQTRKRKAFSDATLSVLKTLLFAVILKETAKKHLFLTFFDGFSLKTCTGSKNCKKIKPGSSKTCTDSKKCKTQIQCQRSGLDWPGLLHLLHFV